MKNAFLCIAGALVLIVSGCATAPLSVNRDSLDNTGFMKLWNTYAHCKQTSELSDVSTDVSKLADAVYFRYEDRGFVLPLPAKLKRLINHPTNRYAVDVRAMASACSLHAGELALDRGRIDLAQEMFTSVVSLYPQGDSSYYRTQANSYLSAIARGIDLTLRTP